MGQARHIHSLRHLLLTAIAAAIVALVLRVFVIGAFVIPSHSMENTLLAGDHILVSKIALTFNDLERGDVVVFNLPDSLREDKPDEPFIKRVIGLPGDTVVLTRRGIRVNKRPLPNPPESASQTPIKRGRKTIIVPEHTVFVMGDNRENSWDSRYWGCLPEDAIVGIPFMIYWSHGVIEKDSTERIRWSRMFSVIR